MAAVPLAHAQQQQTGQLDASPTLFTVMAALNAAGYDADLDSPTNHPLRKAVREELAKRELASLPPLKQFFAKHHAKDDTLELTQYISFALTCAGPPDFAIKRRDVEIPPDVRGLVGLSPLLQAFYKEAGIASLWERSQPAINQYIAQYHRPVLEAVEQANAYLRQANYGYRDIHFQILLELLAPPNQVQVRSYGQEFTVVVTPSAEMRSFDIRHAYLVYLLDPLATRHQEVLRRKEGLRDHAMRAGALPAVAREDFLVLTTESLVRAVEARLDHKPEMVDEALHEGYILTPFFAEQLPLYEKQQASMQVYYAGLVGAIDLVKEDRRLMAVDFRQSATVKSVKVIPPASMQYDSPGQSSPSGRTASAGAFKVLEDAEQAYQARDLQKAKATFLQLLQQTDDVPLHAKAYYGLARIATLEKDPEGAERLFQKTLDLNPEPADKAWTLVYLGKLELAASQSGQQQGDASASQGGRDRAAQYFHAALEVQGASEAARSEAQKSLQTISKP
jgi:tetratricopeptide (TPR) repeat protein